MSVLAHDLRKSFGSVEVLRGVDLDVPTGCIFALLGPNGAGKTTTVRILTTLLPADAGSATVAGHDVRREPKAVRRAISLTGQHAAVDELLTGEENLLMLGRLRRLTRPEARRRAAELLERFDLVDAARRRVGTYSGGMRRRLDLALGLVVRPAVMFLDEPTTGLDPRSRQTTWDVVRDLAADGVTIFLTTQYLEEADQLADRVALVDHGAIVAEGTPDELKWQLSGERVELRFADDAGAGLALALFPDATIEERTVSVPTDGSAAALHRVLDRLADHDVSAETVALRRPSLDDVFLALTTGR